MTTQSQRPPGRRAGTLRFTPAEWKALLEDESFLRDPDNSCRPRRLMGLPVEIVPDHWSAVFLSLAVFAATPAFAQDLGTIATASAAPPPPAAAPAAAPLPLGEPEADPDSETAPRRDGKIHGMVEAGVGTGGYRHGAAVVTGPLGKDGEMTIAVSATQIGDQRRDRKSGD